MADKNTNINSISNKLFADPDTFIHVMRFPHHGSDSKLHCHDFSELVIILDGYGEHKVGEETYFIETGDVFVILGDTTHGYPKTDNLSLINILYYSEKLGLPLADIADVPGYHALFTLEPKLRREGKFKNRLRLSMEDLGMAVKLVYEMEEELTGKRYGRRYMSSGYLIQLIGFLSRCYSDIHVDRGIPVTQISEVLGFLDRNFDQPISIDQLADMANMSQTTLMRTFTKIVGRTPIDYLIRLRISKAEQLLKSSSLNITEIALRVGFSDSNYFSRQFRQVRRKTPREFRQETEGRRR